MCVPAASHMKLFIENCMMMKLALLSDAISIDLYHIIRNHHQNKTMFDKKGTTFYEVDGIWQLPSTDIDVILNKLKVYTTFI